MEQLYLINIDENTQFCVSRDEISKLKFDNRFRWLYPKVFQKIKNLNQLHLLTKTTRENCHVTPSFIEEIWTKLPEINTISKMLNIAREIFSRVCGKYSFNITKEQIFNLVNCLTKLTKEYTRKYNLIDEKNGKEEYEEDGEVEIGVFLDLAEKIYAIEENCPHSSNLFYNPIRSKIANKALPILLDVCPTDVYKIEDNKHIIPFIPPKLPPLTYF
jgi:hypothetical protein